MNGSADDASQQVRVATPSATSQPASEEPVADRRLNRVTLKQRVMQEPEVPPQPTAGHKRLMDLHVTGFPNNLNRDLLPDHAKTMSDFTEIDPTRYRQNHVVKNENASTMDAASLAEQKRAGATNGCQESMMSTAQVAARLSAMGVQIRQAHERERTMNGSRNAAMERAATVPRGYQSKNYQPAYDGRSTYRHAYDKDEDYSNQDGARRSHLTQYRSGWTDAEKADIDASMQRPFLTQPVSALREDRFRTVYRTCLVPEAGADDFRTLSWQTNLAERGTTFAYSAYTYDDERREITYNAAIASLRDPHSVLEETYAVDGSDLGRADPGLTTTATGAGSRSMRGGSRARDELERLREMRRRTVQRASQSRREKPETVEDVIAGSVKGSVVLPGLRGKGYRRAPGGNADYIFLPRDTFSQRPVDDI